MTIETQDTQNADDEKKAIRQWTKVLAAILLGGVTALMPFTTLFTDISVQTYIAYTVPPSLMLVVTGLCALLHKGFSRFIESDKNRTARLTIMTTAFVLPTLVSAFLVTSLTGTTTKPIQGLGGYELGQDFDATGFHQGTTYSGEVFYQKDISQNPTMTVKIYTNRTKIHKIRLTVGDTYHVGNSAVKEKVKAHVESLYGSKKWGVEFDVWSDGISVLEVKGRVLTLRYPEKSTVDAEVDKRLLRNKVAESLGE